MRLATIAVVILLGAVAGNGQAPASLCQPSSGYVIGFFNGVATDPHHALDDLDAITAVYGTTYNNQSVGYTVFYNPTDGLLQDLAETYAQKLAESPGIQDRWELIWDIFDDGSTAIIDLALSEQPEIAPIIDNLKSALLTYAKTEFENEASGANFRSLVNQFASTLTAYYTEQKKVLVVAHSQGNLFLNATYDQAKPAIASDSLRTVQVAVTTASVRDPSGQYVTSTTDLVIQALVATLGNTLPANKPGPVLAAISTKTSFGHNFINIYMNADYQLLPAIKTLMDDGLAALQDTNTQGSTGFFTVTLTWSGLGDEDLHVIEPDGSHVFYADKQGTTGYLDVDNTYGYGPEHYYASCDPSQIQEGNYQVGINDYNHADGEIAFVQLITQDRVFPVATLPTGPTRGPAGNGSPQPVFAVVVTKNADGTYTVSQQ